ncbi:MAG TPA: triose-phosphate isomerase [Elusimicrobiales bacterium]|nr:triose-phosphate isomerase [Elusimicrobiales bacterium]HOL62518.1 triose-phosphate isomerase [Elusimicrobiales bacterium]HPO94554.1 triose-phosphate isomerase [Elusimicrobiales bacterium]
MRKPMIAGNWKMHLTRKEAGELASAIKKGLDPDLKHEVLLAPSFTNLETVKNIISDSKILLSAQNMCWEEKGAFTGEVSPLQLKDIGCDYVIIGHSERRKIFGETDETLNKKIKSALKNNLKVIFCIGETLEERENNQTYRILQTQIQNGLKEISKEDLSRIVIAYEPVWAIGTGKTATPEQAEDAHIFVRKEISRLYDTEASDNIRILYGGSVKAENIDELMAKPNIDGALVGGESLKADKFLRVIHYQKVLSK